MLSRDQITINITQQIFFISSIEFLQFIIPNVIIMFVNKAMGKIDKQD